MKTFMFLLGIALLWFAAPANADTMYVYQGNPMGGGYAISGDFVVPAPIVYDPANVGGEPRERVTVVPTSFDFTDGADQFTPEDVTSAYFSVALEDDNIVEWFVTMAASNVILTTEAYGSALEATDSVATATSTIAVLQGDQGTWSDPTVPEPATWMLLLAGAAAVLFSCRGPRTHQSRSATSRHTLVAQ